MALFVHAARWPLLAAAEHARMAVSSVSLVAAWRFDLSHVYSTYITVVSVLNVHINPYKQQQHLIFRHE